MASKGVLPTEADQRKNIPIVAGVIDYFSAALAYVAQISKAGNDQHNPGQPLHWARGKSTDHADCIGRHLMERGTFDSDGMRHSGKLAWRALALLQEELEAAGAPHSRGSKFPQEEEKVPICEDVKVIRHEPATDILKKLAQERYEQDAKVPYGRPTFTSEKPNLDGPYDL